MPKPPQPAKPPGTGKLANDRNQAGTKSPTQRHESRRSPWSRKDREDHAGGANQHQLRRGAVGRGPR